TYTATWAANGKLYCPVPGCPGKATTRWNLRRHFQARHPRDLVATPGEGVYPRYPQCSMQTNPTALKQQFTAYGVELERVEVFKYLGRLLTYEGNDIQAVRSNLMKARKCWARISRVLRAENASPRVCGMFYKATVQAVLLFGSETWNLT
ncbi:hypothetical protein ACHAXR_000188, partial [Thalassiosira sp. AJA248-18]